MKIAIEGCCHGELDAIYGHIASLEAKHNYKVDLLLICGDFQAIRNHQDLQCMAVPQKYRQLGEFHNYYTGRKTAPILTIVIGGNHEASNYMWELYHGGWLAPNIYFLGHAGCVQVNGIRIAGASGIFKFHDFKQGHWERLPYDQGAIRSIYHIREYNVRRLSLLSSPTVFLSHDWPQSIEHHGNTSDLLRRKPFLRNDVNSARLGSPPLMGLLRILKPQWWFSAHLHVRFEAKVVHGGNPAAVDGSAAQVQAAANPDEIIIDDDEPEIDTTVQPCGVRAMSMLPLPDEMSLGEQQEGVSASPYVQVPLTETKFLALDKCLPRRDFLEVIDIVSPEQRSNTESSQRFPIITFDPEWLAITRAFHPYLSTTRYQPPFPEETQAREMVRKEMDWVLRNLASKDDDNNDDTGKTQMRAVNECQVFTKTAPGPGKEDKANMQQPPWYTNPQTVAFCSMLELENKINPPPLGAILD